MARRLIDDLDEAVVYSDGCSWTCTDAADTAGVFYDMRGAPDLGRSYAQTYHRGCDSGLTATMDFTGPVTISWIAQTAADSGDVKAWVDDMPSAPD